MIDLVVVCVVWPTLCILIVWSTLYTIMYEIACNATLNIVFSVTYYSALRNTIIIFLYFSFFVDKRRIGCLDIIEH